MSLLDELAPMPLADGAHYPWTGQLGQLPSHLSATQLGLFQRCPEAYRHRYVLGEKERPGAALIWGHADHKAHEENFRQKITTGLDVDTEIVEDAFVTAFDTEVDRLNDEIEWGEEKPGELKDAGAALVAVYHRQVSPSVQPVSVEREFTIELPGVPVPVVGRMDVETALPAIERKTSRARTAKVKPQWRIQGLLYQLVEQRPVVWHVSVKTRTPVVQTQEDTPMLSLGVEQRILDATGLMVANTARTLRAVYEEFGPEQPWPGALSHDWACGYCAYIGRCAWWGNAPAAPVVVPRMATEKEYQSS
jgi:hypothetical protein